MFLTGTTSRCVFALSALLMLQPAYAALIEQERNLVPIGYLSNSLTDIAADNFTLDADYQLQRVTWWGMYEASDSQSLMDDFSISFYDGVDTFGGAVSGTTSAPVTAVTRSDTGETVDFFGDETFFVDLYYYEAVIDQALDAGDYLLSIGNNTSANWYWAESFDGSPSLGFGHYYLDGPAGWAFEDEFNLAFTLDGVELDDNQVPSPMTPLLMIAGLFALMSTRKRYC